MEISPINLLAFATGTVSFVLLLILRLIRKKGKPEVQVIWAALGALGGGAMVKALYPFYRVYKFHALTNIEDLWLYVLVGGLAVAALGFIGIYNAFKAA